MQEALQRIRNMGPGGILDLSDLGLEALPNLPPGVKVLRCSDNRLTQLPRLPSGLRSLECSHNRLTQLPELPSTLVRLWCAENELTTLPELPDRLNGILVSGNPFVEPFNGFLTIYENNGDVEEFKRRVNGFYGLRRQRVRTAGLKPEIIAARYDPRRIMVNLTENEINMNAPLSEANYEKYYERRKEAWTEGVGRAVGGKRKSRRKSKKRKTRRNH